MKSPDSNSFGKLIILVITIFSHVCLNAQSGELDRMSFYEEGESGTYEKINFSFEIKGKILTIYDHSSGKKKIWRDYELLITVEDSEDIKSYETAYSTIRIYFPEKDDNGYKGSLELNIVSFEYHWNWWKFSKYYP